VEFLKYIHKLLHWPYDLVSNNTWVVRCDNWVVTHPLSCDHVSGNQHKNIELDSKKKRKEKEKKEGHYLFSSGHTLLITTRETNE
jgi:hypothetical protein